jgi:dihydrofolate synthase/folylpolyglutamate synthase
MSTAIDSRKRFESYDDAIAWLSARARYGIKLDLARIEALCDSLRHPERTFPAVHITGTNGKGSTAAMVASILSTAGFRTGLFTSPHILDISERFRIDGRRISRAELTGLLGLVKEKCKEIESTPGLDPPTEFEVKCAVAYEWFARGGVDIAVVEVGMGGEFDSTNVVNPLVSIITNVSLDHTPRLGVNVREIAATKSGVIRRGMPVVTAAEDPEVLDVISARTAREGALLVRVAQDGSGDVEWLANGTGEGVSFSLRSSKGPDAGRWRSYSVPVAGRFQAANAACAVTACDLLNESGFSISEADISNGLAALRLSGRLQRVDLGPGRPTLILDVAHNPDAAAHIAADLPRLFQYERLGVIVGMTRGHSLAGFMPRVAPVSDRIFATRAQWEKAYPAEDVAAEASKVSSAVALHPHVAGAVEAAFDWAGPGDAILATGSFFIVDEVIRAVGPEKVPIH